MLATMESSRDVYDYSMTTKYACRELIVKSFYDPVLSGQMNEFVYNFLNRKKSISLLSFSFNDVEKYIDISATGCTGKLPEFINEAFKNLYRQWAFGNDFIRLWSIDATKAEIFRDVVTNDLDSITTQGFSLYSSILILNYAHNPEGTESILTVRIKLV